MLSKCWVVLLKYYVFTNSGIKQTGSVMTGWTWTIIVKSDKRWENWTGGIGHGRRAVSMYEWEVQNADLLATLHQTCIWRSGRLICCRAASVEQDSPSHSAKHTTSLGASDQYQLCFRHSKSSRQPAEWHTNMDRYCDVIFYFKKAMWRWYNRFREIVWGYK